VSRAQYTYRAPFVSYRWADLQARRCVQVTEVNEQGFTIDRYVVKQTWLKPTIPDRVMRESEMPKITVSETGGGSYKGLEGGVYQGRCDMIADLGLQETKFGEKHKIYIRFAIPGQVVEKDDGTKYQMSIGQTFTASLSKRANLRKALEAWRGKPFTEEELKGFDLTKLLNAPATVVVEEYTHEGETKSKIGNILRCKDPVADLDHAVVSYSVESTDAELEEAPQWIRDKIAEQKAAEGEREKQEEAAGKADDEAAQAEGGWEDDIPF
jgi:hypothetical protein